MTIALSPIPTDPRGPDLVDDVLRNPTGLDERTLDVDEHGRTTFTLLAMSVSGLALYGFVVGAAAAALHLASWAQALGLSFAFVASFLGALSICLPSFYFYTQLAGIDASLRIVTIQALRIMTSTTVYAIGALPLYAAFAFGAALGLLDDPHTVLRIGLALPFVLGLFAVLGIRRSFARLAPRLLETHTRRGNILLRLVLAWGAVYSVVAPVALWRALELIGLGG